MASLEDFRKLLSVGDIAKAFEAYQLDFNEAVFDVENEKGYEVEVDWSYEKENKIKMTKVSQGGKKIYYLPWASKVVTYVTLDSSSPPYFVTSHFSNCRFTINFHDEAGQKVTVMHVAGNVPGEGTIRGSQERDKLEKSVVVQDVKKERRLSISRPKTGKSGKNHMDAQKAKGTCYYDSFARVFGVRDSNGCWVFYAQNLNHTGKILGFGKID